MYFKGLLADEEQVALKGRLKVDWKEPGWGEHLLAETGVCPCRWKWGGAPEWASGCPGRLNLGLKCGGGVLWAPVAGPV